jgi:hypothetical protein
MRRAAAPVILLGAWVIMAPPETLNWRCERVQHPEAPAGQWKSTGIHSDTQESCEALRSEFVRRELNPEHRKAAIAHMQEVERNRPVALRLLTPLVGVLGLCSRKIWQPLDFFGHTRCTYVEQQ